jgi:2-iminobutanoate/2-iminopropanoate deaminase
MTASTAPMRRADGRTSDASRRYGELCDPTSAGQFVSIPHGEFQILNWATLERKLKGRWLVDKRVIYSSRIGGPTYTATTAHGTRAGDFVFVTGQVATKPGVALADAGEMGSIEDQTVQVLENIKAILEEAGTSLENVVKRNVYLIHRGDYEPVYRIMERYFPSKVASTGVLTGLIPVSARVEIDVIAIVPS